ncbi:MAG: hypothetical protein WDM96_00975 [Lacunisphaera sp.]
MIPAIPDPTGPSAFAEFLRALLATGAVRVEAYAAAPVEFDAGFPALLAELDEARRREWGPLPPLEPGAARWAAVMIYRACQFLVCREVSAEVVATTLAGVCPGGRTAGAAYSADLFLIFLPDLYALASQLAPEDPLVAGLRSLARHWPLSSVGIAAGPVTLDSFAADPALLRLYATA